MRIIATTIAIATMVISAVSWAATGPRVQLQSGRIEGLQHNGVDVFLGIPYARAPVGDLRWQRPLSATPWNGTRPAKQFGPHCMQAPFKKDSVAQAKVEYSEDCLTLNIWRPTHYQQPLPVMVWLHGGGFVNGTAAEPEYDGQAFARDGVILVSLNYRLGRFGFFAHPALAGNLFRGNYGLMDQIKALRWLQDNIIAFGGDPNNVTLFGESAGGFSIGALLTSNFGRNLFNKAIIQSGGGRNNITPNLSWQQAAQSGIQFAAQHNISGDDKQALAQLRALPASALQGELNLWTMHDQANTYSGPMIDGRIISGEPQEAYRSGNFAHVPLLIGTNSLDLGFVIGQPADRKQVFRQAGLDETAAQQAYQQVKVPPKALAYRIAMQKLMTEPARFMARQFTQQQVPVWQYRFGYVAQSKQDELPGALHATEIPYVFNTLLATYHDALTHKDQQVADLMHQYWVNFAITGNPNGNDLPLWPQYRPRQDQLFWFSDKGRDASAAIQDPQQAQLDVIEQAQP